MATMQVKQVNFRDGVYLAGAVKQSVGVDGPEGSLYGVTAVSSVELTNHGAIITMNGRRFLVPWGAITSVELFPDVETPAEPAKAAAKR